MRSFITARFDTLSDRRCKILYKKGIGSRERGTGEDRLSCDILIV
jgi:hypothetical protein